MKQDSAPTTTSFPNRTYPWRPEDDNDAEALIQRERRTLATKLNEAFRRRRGLTRYVHRENRIEDEACMYDALEELGMFKR